MSIEQLKEFAEEYKKRIRELWLWIDELVSVKVERTIKLNPSQEQFKPELTLSYHQSITEAFVSDLMNQLPSWTADMLRSIWGEERTLEALTMVANKAYQTSRDPDANEEDFK